VGEPEGKDALSASAPAVRSVERPPKASVAAPGFTRRLLRRPVAVISLAYLIVLVGVAIVAPIALPGVAGQHAGNLLAARQEPSAHHLLGTDTLGRDVLDRLLVGTRVTILGVAEALAVVVVLGVPLGLLAGFVGGWIDTGVTWLADIAFSIPAILIMIVVVSVFPHSLTGAMIAFGVLAAPGLMRVVRAGTLTTREELYIAAARVSGLSRPYIVSRHVLPRITGAIIVQASLLAAIALIVQTGLAFLGLVVAAPAPSWGGMVADGASVIALQSWLIWPPGIAIALTILAFGLLGDSVRDAATENWEAPPRRRRSSRARAARTTSGATAEAEALERNPLLAIRHLRVVLELPAGPTTVIDDVSLDIAAGETVGLVGETGCGKTMTAMSILGLLPAAGRVASGSILFLGRDLAALSEGELRKVRGKEIGVVSQEPMISLNPAFSVGWQVAEAARAHHGLSRTGARARAISLLGDVGLPEPERVARRYPHELSGGMAQRVAIARALAGEPRLLIADEPTTALDVTVQADILDLLRELQRERQLAILLVTHDWGVVADICDRAVVMYAGQVVERAELLEIFSEPLHPYTRALLESNPHGAVEAELLPTIAGAVPQPGAWPSGCHFHPRCRYASDACCEQPIELQRPSPERETRCVHYEQLLPVP
jgi:peptide/nickel transport system permease protein